MNGKLAKALRKATDKKPLSVRQMGMVVRYHGRRGRLAAEGPKPLVQRERKRSGHHVKQIQDGRPMFVVHPLRAYRGRLLEATPPNKDGIRVLSSNDQNELFWAQFHPKWVLDRLAVAG